MHHPLLLDGRSGRQQMREIHILDRLVETLSPPKALPGRHLPQLSASLGVARVVLGRAPRVQQSMLADELLEALLQEIQHRGPPLRDHEACPDRPRIAQHQDEQA